MLYRDDLHCAFLVPLDAKDVVVAYLEPALLLEAQEATSKLIQDLDEPNFEYQVACIAAHNLHNLLGSFLYALAGKGIQAKPTADVK